MKKNLLGFIALCFFSLALFVWSFTLTDPNLYMSTQPVFISFQNMLWKFALQRQSIVIVYALLIAIAFGLYGAVLQKRTAFPFGKEGVIGLSLCILLLLLANPALSHDMYNYMFNAKAVLVYGKDPHIFSALEVAPQDEWVRFMHNVHTPAPYGYAWTAFSLLPSLLGMGKFISTFLAFKLFSLTGLVFLVWTQILLAKKLRIPAFSQKILWFICNPLILIETLLNGHNDAWMMALFFLSILLLTTKSSKIFWSIVSLGVFVLSTQIKLATALLFPIWVYFLIEYTGFGKKVGQAFHGLLRFMRTYWAELASVCVFLPLLTDRSQQFHPWYLLWSLSFLPFIQVKSIKAWLLIFSCSSMLRYIPFLLDGNYTDSVQQSMRLITWSGVPATVVWVLVMASRGKKRT